MLKAVVLSSRSDACRRNARCREGREDVKDDATSGRPSTARTDEEVEAVCRLRIDDVASPSELMQNIPTSIRIQLAQWWSNFWGEKGVCKICASRFNNAAGTGKGYVLSGPNVASTGGLIEE